MSNTAIRDRVVALVSQGYNQNIVAAACGVTPGYVSQLLEQDDVREKVVEKRAATLEEAAAVDKSINDLEKRALQLIADKMPFVRGPMEATKMFATLNAAKRRTQQTDASNDSSSVEIVTLTIPKAAMVHIKVNSDNQVIEVEGRSMAPLPSKALPGLAASMPRPPLVLDTDVAEANMTKPRPNPTTARLQQNDVERAAVVIKNLTAVINGIECVL